MIDEGQRRLVVGALVVGVVLDVAYWTAWFVHRSLVRSSTGHAYYVFENAFPLADLWLACCLGLAAWSLRHRRAAALFWLIASGAAGLYLFAMDSLYDLEHGVWWHWSGAVELFINVVTLAGSTAFLLWGWRRRDALLAGE